MQNRSKRSAVSSEAASGRKPVDKIWFHELVKELFPEPWSPKDLVCMDAITRHTAIGNLRKAIQSERGAACLSCGRVVRGLQPGLHRGVTIHQMEINGPSHPLTFWGIVCCDLCRERLNRVGDCGL
jgi:hypothetical protein